MNRLITENINKLIPLFQSHQIEKAFIFGSAITDRFNSESDIDFIISFKPGLEPLEKGELWWSLHDSLRELFNRDIDLVTEGSLKNPYFIAELNQTRQIIYE
ncbi:MAG: nucleotidyltransferase domain-containing protein [Bacteroidales bacterium]